MSDPLRATPPTNVSAHPVDRTMLNRTILRPSSDVQGTTMEGETVLLDLSAGRYYTLNRLGSVILERCTGQSTMADIHRAICERFEVAPEQALDDLVALANELIQEGLLQQERRGRINGTEERAVCPAGGGEARVAARHHSGAVRPRLS
jgi:hypothetical protein